MTTVAAIVPTLDEASQIEAALASLAGFDTVVVADGGSIDATVALARGAGARVVEAAGGRAAQCNAGAAAGGAAHEDGTAHGSDAGGRTAENAGECVRSGGRGPRSAHTDGAGGAECERSGRSEPPSAGTTGVDALVFVHADSRLPPSAADAIRQALADPAVVGGNFALAFEGGDRFARTLTAVYRVQRRFGFYYGDSTIWCRCDAFEALGGFKALPIMDDYDFVRRLEGHGRTVCLPGPATTSDRRWRAIGIPRTLAAWVVIRWLYVAGVSPERLTRLYRAVR